MSDKCTAIIDRIIELRKNQKMTQKDLAKAACLMQPAVARLENKTAVPKLDTLLKVLEPLGQTIEIVPIRPTVKK